MTRTEWPSLPAACCSSSPSGEMTENGMLRFVFTRLSLVVPTFIGITLLAVRADPLDPRRSDRDDGGRARHRSGPTTRSCARTTASTSRCWSNTASIIARVLQGDLGRSIVTHEPVISEFRHVVPGNDRAVGLRDAVCAVPRHCRPASSPRSGATPSSITA